MFRITHPFHPLCGRQFELVELRSNWGEERVYYQEANGRLKSLPACWTSVCAPEPVVALGAGRTHFRVIDLLELHTRLQEIGR